MSDQEKLLELKTSLNIKNTKDLIPFFFMLSLDGSVFSLKKHFQFEPVFSLERAKRLCLMCARQVGKSVSICSRSLLLGWLFPGYRCLFVLPRFEQTKRLSNDTMKLLINTSPYKDVFVDSSCDQTALFRSFNNNSVQYFQYAFLDPDRIRGIQSISDVIYDECISSSSIITCEDPIEIKKIKSTKELASLNRNGYIVPSIAEAAQYRGIRNCFRITLEDGKYVEATIDHRFPTNLGWKTTEELAEYVYFNQTKNSDRIESNSNTNDYGNTSEGRLHLSNKQINSKIPIQPQLETTQIQLPQMPDITEIRNARTLLEREQKLRHRLINTAQSIFGDICLFTKPVLSTQSKPNPIHSTSSEEQRKCSITSSKIKANLSKIVKIEYAGYQEVYDIAVAGTNTFFANGIAVHNCQDINWDFMPVIDAVTDAVERWGFKTYSGTPKTLDNTLTSLFEDSSQAEWVTKCGCGKFNIPSIDHDLLKMIGRDTCICAACGKPLDCSKGAFVHRFPKKRQEFSGYHVSQVTHPLHYTHPEKWLDLLYKMKNYHQSRFYNEVLGIPCDSAEKLITQSELQQLCSEDDNTLENAINKSKSFSFRAIGIDWGGGGDETQSYTAIALGGLFPGQEVIEVVYAVKLNRNMPSWEQAEYILDLVKKFNPNFIAHDYGGAGCDKETILIQAGFPLDKVAPFTYTVSSAKPIISYNPPISGYRCSYSLDKMRSIVVLVHMMKARKIRFPSWESMTEVDTGVGTISLLEDFLYINAERIERPRGSDVIQITKTPRKSDDFVHAVNYLCSCVWYSHQRYPNIAEAANMQLTAEDVAALHPLSPMV